MVIIRIYLEILVLKCNSACEQTGVEMSLLYVCADSTNPSSLVCAPW